MTHLRKNLKTVSVNLVPGPKFTDDLRTIFRQFSKLQQSGKFWQLANSQNTYDNRKTYLKTKYYDHLLDVLKQLGSNSQIGLLSS